MRIKQNVWIIQGSHYPGSTVVSLANSLNIESFTDICKWVDIHYNLQNNLIIHIWFYCRLLLASSRISFNGFCKSYVWEFLRIVFICRTIACTSCNSVSNYSGDRLIQTKDKLWFLSELSGFWITSTTL